MISGDDEHGRHTALFDPDTVHPVAPAASEGRKAGPDAAGSPGEAPADARDLLFARSERARRAPAMSPEAIRRMADRAERLARKRES